MGFSQYIEPLPGSGYGGNGKDAFKGEPVFVGRNRTITLTLDVTDAPSDAVVSVYIETSASKFSKRWRTIGSTVSLTGTGSSSVTASNADAFIRARYTIAIPSGADAIGLSLTGHAQQSLLASASHTTSGNGSVIDMAQYHGGRFAARVTQAPLSQTLALTIERSGDGLSWSTAATFASITATGEFTVESADLDRFVRVKWTPSSSGTWTFDVTGTAHLIFARTRDRARLGIRNGAIPDTTSAQYLDAFLTATATVISYYNRYDHPLRGWGDDTSQSTIALADWQLLTTRSKDPSRANEGGSAYQVEADRWTQWLGLVAGVERNRKLVPSNIIDSAPANEEGEVKRWSFDSNPNPFGKSSGYGGGI